VGGVSFTRSLAYCRLLEQVVVPVHQVVIHQRSKLTVQSAFEFGSDALDQAVNFATTALNNSQDFGRDILSEVSDISRDAIQVAGNAQTNAFAKINDIAASFSNSSNSKTTMILLSILGAAAVVIFFIFSRKE